VQVEESHPQPAMPAAVVDEFNARMMGLERKIDLVLAAKASPASTAAGPGAALAPFPLSPSGGLPSDWRAGDKNQFNLQPVLQFCNYFPSPK
jgi:hypothetical protein